MADAVKEANRAIAIIERLDDAIAQAYIFRKLIVELHSRARFSVMKNEDAQPAWAVRAALLRSLVALIVAILDSGDKGRGNRGSFGQLSSFLADSQIRHLLARPGQHGFQARVKTLGGINRRYALMRKGSKFKNLINLRHKHVGHNLLGPDIKLSSYSDIYDVFAKSVALLDDLYASIFPGKLPTYKERQTDLNKAAKRFWRTYYAGVASGN